MILNNLKLTFRRFGNQKLNTSLHIVGLTIGISACMLIGVYLKYENSYDGYHDLADRIYRINSIWSDAGKLDYHFSSPLPLSRTLRSEATGIEKTTLAHPMSSQTVVEINPTKRFAQDHILIVEPDFLDIFNIEVISGGTGHDVLRKPYQAILSESIANKYYGKENPLGKTFIIKNKYIVTVAGLMKDIPSNSHLPASMLISYTPDEDFMGSEINAWTYVSGTSTFVVLPPTVVLANITKQLVSIADKNINAVVGNTEINKSYFDLQLLSAIHTDTKYAGGGRWVKAVNPKWLWFFGIIGLLVLILACINFINLSTAQAMTRAKEIGVRKTNGANRWQLIRQFLLEASTLTTISGLLSCIITYNCLPFINNLLNKQIPFDLLLSPNVWFAFLTGLVITSILAGLYPAWLIAKFNPVNTLKAGGPGLTGDPQTIWMRKTLVVTQFTISIGLMIAVALIAQQVQFLRNKDLGFNKQNIVNVEIDDVKNMSTLASDLRQLPRVTEISFATAPPNTDGHWGTIMSKTNRDDPNRIDLTLIFCDENYSKLYGLNLIAGRLNQASDTIYTSKSLPEAQQLNKVVVNEKLLESMAFGTPAEAIGKKFWAGFSSGNMEIVGVLKDFNTSSLHAALTPMLLTTMPNNFQQVGIRIEAVSDISSILAKIEQAWKKSFPKGIFTYKFLDEQIDAYYSAEIKLYTLFKVFAGLAMIISCLGLWGLASFAAHQRAKEVGIRKVLGASVSGIAALLSKDFIKLVAVSVAIATPIAWYLMHDWLQEFAYRISIDWKVIVMVGIVAVCIAVLTVSYQAMKAAMANPVESLKTE